MQESLILAGVGICCLIAVQRWWSGIWLCLVVGFFQDPLRKIVPGEPVYMVTLCAVVFFAVVLGLVWRRYNFRFETIPGWQLGISNALYALMMVVTLHLIIAYVSYGSLFIVGLGMLNYFAPVLAILVGYYFACFAGEQGVESFLRFYAILCVAFGSGIYLEYFGMGSDLLGEVGVGLTIYDVGTVLKAYSGFLRSSEIAAWHVVFGSSVMMLLAVRSQSTPVRMLYIAGIILLIGAGILTGRRKLVVTIVIFLTAYWFLMTFFQQRSLRVAVMILLLGLTSLYISGQRYLVAEQGDRVYDLYVERASGVFGDISERAKLLGVGAVISAVRKYGFIGNGAGTVGQGARFSGTATLTTYESESGLGKIVVELGLIGLLTVLWVITAFIWYLWKLLLYLSYKSDSYSSIAYGLMAILLANLAHFTIASQVFGDPFVLLLLGLCVGMIVSSPVLAGRKSTVASSG